MPIPELQRWRATARYSESVESCWYRAVRASRTSSAAVRAESELGMALAIWQAQSAPRRRDNPGLGNGYGNYAPRLSGVSIGTLRA